MNKKTSVLSMAKLNALSFLNEISNYSSQLNNLGHRGNNTIKIPYGDKVLYENKPVEYWEIHSSLLILGWEPYEIRRCEDEDEDNTYYVSVTII